MKKFIKEFKEFISKGNILDMAIGIIIGTAFQAIVKSLANDILYPLISLIIGQDFTSLYVLLNPSCVVLVDGFETTLGALQANGTTLVEFQAMDKAVLLTYGNLIQNIVDFLIIALSIFVGLKAIMAIKHSYAKKRIKFLKKMRETNPEQYDKDVANMKTDLENYKKGYPEEFKEELEAEAALAAANAPEPEPTTNDLLKEILNELKKGA